MDPSAAVLSHLAGASIRSLCLAILALLALRLGRVRSASVKHAVWTITLGAMLSLPFLTPFLPPLPVPILPGAKSAIEEPVPQVFTVTVPPLPGYGQSRAARPSWQRLLLALYCGALLVMLGRLIVSCLLVRRLVRSSTPIRDAAACGALKRLAHGRTPALRESGRISVPMTAGWIKPDILLPSSWRDWDEAALVHELAHVRRGDPLIALAAGFNKCIFWFHPLAWWTERKLASLAEEAADDCSLLALGDRHQYAGALLEMAAAVRTGRGRLHREALAMARLPEVHRRIERVLDESSHISRGLTRARWMALLLPCAALLYGAAALRLESAQPPPQAPAVTSPPPAVANPPAALPQRLSDEEKRQRDEKLRKELETPYRKWVNEDAAYIISDEERKAFEQLTTDEEREKFIEQFWLRRDPTPGTAENEFKEEHYRRIAYANERFPAGRLPGWKTHRGRAYIILGPPDEKESHPAPQDGTPPYEIWRYRGAREIGENGDLRFVDSSMTGDYRLVGAILSRTQVEQSHVEIRAPLDPAWMQFKKTDGVWQAKVNVYGRVVSPGIHRDISAFKEVLTFDRSSESSGPEPLWFQKSLQLPPGGYQLKLVIQDLGSGRIESRDLTLTVPMTPAH